ncbi:NACHT and WD repeat domain-containing protein 2 isoform X2 [Antennarius striatus]|uniref:NACHT and WD repeat domain-containing protein 2 isoform X2 n=1 Tax=Antennarius striatus TaxID=241820 RepID=UPI0035B3F3A4
MDRPPGSAHRSSCVKLYLCSNPEDSTVERNTLRKSVFPKLREHCRHTRGLDVRVIDPFEASDSSRWPDEQTRQQLINECRDSSAGPFLLALIGHQYGKAELPTQVEVSEFQLLLQESQQAKSSTLEVEGAYRRDENTTPPSFCLRPRRSTCCPQSEVKKEEKLKPKPEDDGLRRLFQTAVSRCVHKGLLSSDRAQRYYRSVLDVDLRFALENQPKHDIAGRCLVYIHKVINAKGEKEKRMNSQIQPQPETTSESNDGKLLSHLCDSFLPGLITSSQLLVYAIATECDHRHGYTTAKKRSYAQSLCQQVYADVVRLIDNVNISETSERAHIGDAFAREQEEQEELCKILSSFYEIIRPEEEKIRAYVQQREQQRPLVVVGGPCTGKAVLLAHCAQKIKSWLPDSNPVVLTYFLNLSNNLSPKHLLLSLCSQIAGRYRHSRSLSERNLLDDPSCSNNNSNCILVSNLDHHERITGDHVSHCCEDLSVEPYQHHSGIINPDLCLPELKEHFSSLLSLMPSTKNPLFLIFDGLDHVDHTVGPQIIESLPSPLPPNVKVLLAISAKRTQILQAVDPQSPACEISAGREESGYECVALGLADRKQCVRMLASLLSRSGRSVTSGQQALVNQVLTSCCLPLYARLLHLHTSCWHSDSDVTDSSLPDGVHSSICALLDHLEHKHGSSLVVRALSYLTLSRTGLTEAELSDLLSSDDKVLLEYVQQNETPSSDVKVPQVDVETFLLDLRSFLTLRTVKGSKVFFWVSRHFKLAVTKRYLGSHDLRKEIHSAMADYFSGQWARGITKPSLANQKSLPNKETAHIAPNTDWQPFIFASSLKDIGRVNRRKVLELPHHLQESNKFEELEVGLLLSLGFHQAMVRAGLLGNLLAMLEGEQGSPHWRFSRERGLVANILKSCACFLQSSSLQLPTVMETSLFPYLQVFPALRGFFREIREERRKRGSGLGVVLCPAPSLVPSIHCLKSDITVREVSVTEVAGNDCGMVAMITDDGTAWFWKGSGFDVVKLLLSWEKNKLKFAGLKSSGPYILLFTRCNKLFCWDVTGPEVFVQLNAESESKDPTSNIIDGFVACQKKLFIWFKDESFVRMFDVSSETVTHFQCQSCVTCLVCSSTGLYMFCGQQDSTVSIFDTNTLSLLGTCSDSKRDSVTLIILCEDKWEMACMDWTGNLTLWDVTAKTQPPRLVTKILSCGKSDNILNTDYSEEINTLLVCQSHLVTLWDTCDWEPWDKFLSPHESAFTHAVLSQDGHLFLALLDACPFVLVWRVSTGECVLSLETNGQPHTLLKTASDIICVAPDVCLTVWDAEMIDAAGASPTMRSGVKELVAGQTGDWFYTTDGLVMVWRWSLKTGVPDANLLHEGPVTKLRLSPDDLYLVTLSAGEIYVWQTEMGQNILRLSGSGASDVLITPNNNFGISLSDQRLSRVWKLAHGSIVCSIHLYLSDAQVSHESTFLIGRRGGDLLAASLWSGSINKRFSCVESSENVIAFQILSHPDFVVVMGASGAVYTWNIAEETVCKHFQLPYVFHCQPQDFQMSCDGNYALLSTDNESINLLNLSRLVLCSFKAEGPVINACLDKTGCYTAYISSSTPQEESCVCSLHARPILTVVRLADGERIGSVFLPKQPLTLVVCKCVFVGFEDGSVGVYSISDGLNTQVEPVGCSDPVGSKVKQCPFDRTPVGWLPRTSPNVTWP